jgi:hypothetical protein
VFEFNIIRLQPILFTFPFVTKSDCVDNVDLSNLRMIEVEKLKLLHDGGLDLVVHIFTNDEVIEFRKTVTYRETKVKNEVGIANYDERVAHVVSERVLARSCVQE